jgi:hypothetical protein
MEEKVEGLVLQIYLTPIHSTVSKGTNRFFALLTPTRLLRLPSTCRRAISSRETATIFGVVAVAELVAIANLVEGG